MRFQQTKSISQKQHSRRRSCRPVLLAVLGTLLAVSGAQRAEAAFDPKAPVPMHEVGREEYIAHLQLLADLVGSCQQLRSAEVCDPREVGDDEWLEVPGQVRHEVRYRWLRVILAQASTEATAKKAATVVTAEEEHRKEILGVDKPKDLNTLLKEAEERLHYEIQLAAKPGVDAIDYPEERFRLNSILSERVYQGSQEVSWRERWMERVGNWINRMVARIYIGSIRMPWLGWLLWGVLIVGVSVGLVYFLVKAERRTRLRLVPELEGGAQGPSARPWQLWMQDARTMASAGLWREAVHFVYWASISRLESKRMWSADRTRTPREYLTLVPGDDSRKPSLIALTRNFERTWYGGREATAEDFELSLKQAAELGVE